MLVDRISGRKLYDCGREELSLEVQVNELSEKDMENLSERIVEKLINAQNKKRKEIRDNAYHNTRTLLRNYYKLKKHCEIVDQQVEEEFLTMWSDWRFDVDSLLEHKAKTAKIMKHIDKALSELKEEDKRAFDILEMKYLLPKCFTDEYIGGKYNVDRRTIGKWIKKSVEDLSTIIFGVEVIVDWL